MRLTKLELANWKNFTTATASLSPRTFIVGNNGTGKSNLLDALRFLRDIANPKGGGLQSALDERGGIKQVRSLFARSNPSVGVCVEVENGKKTNWRYEISVKQEQSGNQWKKRRVLVQSEKVSKNGKLVLERPDKKDSKDSDRLTQTALEQTNFNKKFRELSEFFQSFKYLHIVPQFIRHGADIQGKVLRHDPFGQSLMDTIAASPVRSQQSRLRRIGGCLGRIKPAFKGNIELQFYRDQKTGKPHLKFKHPSWGFNDSWQTEEVLSDGELRLIGLLWTLLENNSVTLLEEPELSFNEGIVEKLAGLFATVQEHQKKNSNTAGQLIMSTHSHALLSDEDIGPSEILLLESSGETTKIVCGDEDQNIARDFESGVPAAQAVLRRAQSDTPLLI